MSILQNEIPHNQWWFEIYANITACYEARCKLETNRQKSSGMSMIRLSFKAILLNDGSKQTVLDLQGQF